MKYVNEYRDAELVNGVIEEIRRTVTRPWTLMEICGGQTHAIVRHGIDQLLPPEIELVHGPGCPVCVTPLELIDKALAIASRPDVIFCSYGDMLRVPGSRRDLFSVKAQGGDVRVVYSPLDAVRLAQQNPDKQVVTGFEPLDIVQGILKTVQLLEAGKAEVANAYARAVTLDGNQPAQKSIQRVFQECDRKWRGIGLIPMSGWDLRPEFEAFNAEKRFHVEAVTAEESPVCIAGEILQGLKKPQHCPAFGKTCTPENPLGATMVSSEGACAAYYRYGRDRNPQVLLAG